VRTDLALVGYLEDPRHALSFEVQLDVDPDKEWSVVLYRAGLRRTLKCPTWAVFFSPDPKVRNDVCERRFREEPELRPYVVMPAMVPIVRDLDAAIADYSWAVLAATVHATDLDAVVYATVAIQALLCVAPEDYGRYIQLVSASVGENIMQQVREQLPPDEREELSEWERRGSMFTRGRAEGLQEGLEQGRVEGLEALRAALRTVLAVRGLNIDDQAQQQIAACTDIDELRRWIDRAATIATTAELFA
jgi:hypothetical protein